jgi:hypothetical protein
MPSGGRLRPNSNCSNDFPLPSRTAPVLAVRGRLPRSGKPSRLIPSLRSVPRSSRDAVGRQMPGGIIAGGGCDLHGSQGANSPRGIAAPIFLLRSEWPAPDGRSRPAPARRARAALSRVDATSTPFCRTIFGMSR